jgi:hypothetical protein
MGSGSGGGAGIGGASGMRGTGAGGSGSMAGGLSNGPTLLGPHASGGPTLADQPGSSQGRGSSFGRAGEGGNSRQPGAREHEIIEPDSAGEGSRATPGATDEVPAAYRDLAEQYFRRLAEDSR